MEGDELARTIKKKNDILRRIEENRRLMELIRNPHIKDTLGPMQIMQKNMAVKKIQSYWRTKRAKNKISDLKIVPHNNNFKRKIILLQRAIRNFLSLQSKKKLTMHYVNEYNRELFAPLKFDRANALKNEMIANIKSEEAAGANTNFQEVLNEYYSNYKKFNEDFPSCIKLRNQNLSKYYQCMSLVNHMSTQSNLGSLSKFTGFYLDSSKKDQVKSDLNNILNSFDSNMWWYKYRDVDEFEENNIVNEIEAHFNFERVDEILSRKK